MAVKDDRFEASASALGSATTSGFSAADFAHRVDQTGGDVTAAVHQWLVETSWIFPDAHITHLEALGHAVVGGGS